MNTQQLDEHYGRKTSTLRDWVRFELEDKIRIEQLARSLYEENKKLRKENVQLEIDFCAAQSELAKLQAGLNRERQRSVSYSEARQS